MKRPALREVPVDMNKILQPGKMTITMSVGQWDGFLQVGYDEGAYLLELDENERPVKMYKKEED